MSTCLSLIVKNRFFPNAYLRARFVPGQTLSLAGRSLMLEIFRRNRFFNSLLLLPYTILVRVWLVFDGQAPPFTKKGVLSEWVFGSLDVQSGFALFLSIVLVYFQALLLNRLVIRNRITGELTLFPGLFYILLVSFFPEYNGLSAPLVANTFVIVALTFLMSTHKTSGNAARIFSAGFWFGLAFLFYFGHIVLFLSGIVGLSLLRTVKSREWIQFVSGFSTPLWIVGLLDYLIHSDIQMTLGHFTGQLAFLDIDIPFGLPLYLQLIFFGLLIGIVTINYARFSLRQNIHVQKKINMLYTILYVLFGVVFVQANVYYEEWTTISLPLACFLAIIFVRSSQLLILEIIHFVMLLSVLGLQIYTLL